MAIGDLTNYPRSLLSSFFNSLPSSTIRDVPIEYANLWGSEVDTGELLRILDSERCPQIIANNVGGTLQIGDIVRGVGNGRVEGISTESNDMSNSGIFSRATWAGNGFNGNNSGGGGGGVPSIGGSGVWNSGGGAGGVGGPDRSQAALSSIREGRILNPMDTYGYVNNNTNTESVISVTDINRVMMEGINTTQTSRSDYFTTDGVHGFSGLEERMGRVSMRPASTKVNFNDIKNWIKENLTISIDLKQTQNEIQVTTSLKFSTGEEISSDTSFIELD